MPRFAIIPKARRANTLILSLVFVTVISLIVVTLFSRTDMNVRSTSQRINEQEAIRIAEAGIEKTVWCLNNPANVTDCDRDPTYAGEDNIAFGRGAYTTQAVVNGSTSATIDSYGTVTGAGGSVTKHLRVNLSTTDVDVAFQYGVQAGIGGIEMYNNAYVDGNVYAGGSVSGTNGSYIDGDAILTKSNPTPAVEIDPSVSPLNTLYFGNGNTTKYLAQSFTATMTEKIFSLELKMARVNDPPLSVTFYIYSDASGSPGVNLSGTGQALEQTIFPTNGSGWANWFTTLIFDPNINPVLQVDTKYWLVMGIAQTNGAKYWLVARDADGTTYPDETAKIGGGVSSLSDACVGGCDIALKINMGGVEPQLDVPNVHGSAYSYYIEDAVMEKEAHYHEVDGTVKANNGAITCADGNNNDYCKDYDVSGEEDPMPVSFPISEAQVSQMEAQAEVNVTDCSETCEIDANTSIGPRRYDGDLTITNGAQVTLTGTVWVNGDIIIENNAALILSDDYGAGNGVIIADHRADRSSKGKIAFQNNGYIYGNTYGVSCAGSPLLCVGGSKEGDSCATVYDCSNTYIMVISMHYDPNFTTSSIDINNNLEAGIIYAPYGIVELSNNATLKEVTAQKIVLLENCHISYESGLADLKFTSGPGASWIYQTGTYQIID